MILLNIPQFGFVRNFLRIRFGLYILGRHVPEVISCPFYDTSEDTGCQLPHYWSVKFDHLINILSTEFLHWNATVLIVAS